MKFSFVNGTRSLPQPRLKGLCPGCGCETLSKCGRRIVWHWAHASKLHCDSWWENETEWHREWKNHFPVEWQEIVMRDSASGEKHIADVKTLGGVVIEFQNSAMTSQELESREAFYGNMAWILNGGSFVRQFHILDCMPYPDAPAFQDIGFFDLTCKTRGCARAYYKRSEYKPGRLVEVHDWKIIQADIDANFLGHHRFDWVRPRSVWYEATAPVYFDFGKDHVWRLCRFKTTRILAVRAVSKADFISSSIRGEVA